MLLERIASKIKNFRLYKIKRIPKSIIWKLFIKGSWSFTKSKKAQEFRSMFTQNLKKCEWNPHPLYSVFTQYDQEYYLKKREDFLHKYHCFYAVAKTIYPQTIIELGTHAGSSADAYISAAPTARYLGIDIFGEGVRHDNNIPWKPYEVAQTLLAARGFTNYELMKADLRTLEKLPWTADLVVVDAAHDFANEYADLKLALTANPDFIFVDDADDPDQARPAIEKFLNEDVKDRVEYTVGIDYIDGGLIIKLKKNGS